ncbi:MAG: transposase [Planctomycetota bacterium]
MKSRSQVSGSELVASQGWMAPGNMMAARQSLREEHSPPLLNDLKTWLDAEVFLPKSLSGKAATYTLNQWAALNRYLEDGNLSIDHNASERAMRPVAIGRKKLDVCRQQTRWPPSCDPDVIDRQLQSQSRGIVGMAEGCADSASAWGISGVAAAEYLAPVTPSAPLDHR